MIGTNRTEAEVLAFARNGLASRLFFHDMGVAPKGTFLDRIDNDKGYSKANCKWSTAKEQQRNTRRNRRITANGKTLCMAEWAEVLGVNISVVASRIDRGWDHVKAVTTPPKRKSSISQNPL